MLRPGPCKHRADGSARIRVPAGAHHGRRAGYTGRAVPQRIPLERLGLSLGAVTGLWLAAKHPQRVKSLSLHSGWIKTDPYLKAVVEGWQSIAKGLGDVTEMIIQGIFPWCFTPELYAANPLYIVRDPLRK
jgi:pimeloyl-ACP methyl ester carboxylesterase